MLVQRNAWLGTRAAATTRRLVVALLCLSTASIGCTVQHAEVPPGHREWGACSAIGAVTGAAVGAGIGLAITTALIGPDKSSTVTPQGNPLIKPTSGVTCPLGIDCPDPGSNVSFKSEDPNKWLGALGAIPGSIAGALIGHYLCDPVIAEAEMPPPPQVVETVVTPAPPPPPAQVRIAKVPPERIVLRGIHFAFGKYDIRPESEPVLEEAALALKKHPRLRIEVNGYCDIIGSDAYNRTLSVKRAEAVRNYLIEEGISPTRLIARGLGKTHFVASNDTDEGRAQNRRVELVPMGYSEG